MLLLALLFFGIAIVLFWLAFRQRKTSGVPSGKIIYSDTRAWSVVEKPFYDVELHITGRPDYLVQQGDLFIPVEVKQSRASDAPFDSHIYQLAAYCLLVHHAYGKRPTHGILHYTNRTFAIDYTPQLELALRELLSTMQTQEHKKDIIRSHDSPGRCKNCGYRATCDQKLT